MRCVRKGTPAVGSIGFGADRVSGRIRVPSPPTRITASTSVTGTLWHIPRGDRGLRSSAQNEPGGADAERRGEIEAAGGHLGRAAIGIDALNVAVEHSPVPSAVTVAAGDHHPADRRQPEVACKRGDRPLRAVLEVRVAGRGIVVGVPFGNEVGESAGDGPAAVRRSELGKITSPAYRSTWFEVASAARG